MSQEKRPAYQWYPKDFGSDEHVRLMSYEQEGVYRALLDHAWLNGSIPADLPSIARMLSKGMTPKRLERLWPGIAPCWIEGDGRLTNGRQERQRAESTAHKIERAVSGTRGAATRWKKDGSASDSANGSATSQPMAPHGSASAFASPTTTTKPRQRRSAAADKRREIVNWLSPYLSVYKQHVGEPMPGRIAVAVEPVEKEVGPTRALALWTRWCLSDKTEFGPQHFSRNWKKVNRKGQSQQERNLAVIDETELPDGLATGGEADAQGARGELRGRGDAGEGSAVA